jgi:AraC-like DNA-binding protein
MASINMYEEIRHSLRFSKFEFGEMLFAEYTCPFEETLAGIWTPMDSFVHVLQGRKTWRTTQGTWTAERGQTLYIKKGASIIEQHMDEEFCVLLLFVSDSFIAHCVQEVADQLKPEPVIPENEQRALNVESDVVLTTYFQSMLSYFSSAQRPSSTLLKHKLKELILNVLLGGKNEKLASYFRSLTRSSVPPLQEIMTANFCYNLSLEDFARLCGRSLSTFKRDFRAVFQTSPGKWLLQKRLDYAAAMLGNVTLQITQIALESGFEDVSHFTRSFKRKFGVSPSGFRKRMNVSSSS